MHYLTYQLVGGTDFTGDTPLELDHVLLVDMPQPPQHALHLFEQVFAGQCLGRRGRMRGRGAGGERGGGEGEMEDERKERKERKEKSREGNKGYGEDERSTY